MVFLRTMGIEKAFDSLNHSFLLAVLKIFGFGTSFIKWIEAILNKSETCVINSGKARQYSQFPIFIFVMEVLSTLIKNNELIER